jgi:hypothetical protein
MPKRKPLESTGRMMYFDPKGLMECFPADPALISSLKAGPNGHCRVSLFRYDRRPMIDIWVKLVSVQFELALSLLRAFFGIGESIAPVSVHTGPAPVPDQADAPPANPRDKPAQETIREASKIPGVIAFLESATRGATVREIAEHLEMDKKNILPLLKTLVKERRIDELLGRYCVLKS